jgi:large subunit ribosomal protein L35
MPKQKTSRGAAKRFKMTGTGKVRRRKAYLRHILTTKRRKVKRHLRKATTVDPTNAKAIRRLLPYM